MLLFLGVLSFSTFAQSLPAKKNVRPISDDSGSKAAVKFDKEKAAASVYFFEFEKPEFLVSKIIIEHDENGLGKITFYKKDVEENISNPLKLSASTLEKLKNLWQKVQLSGFDRKISVQGTRLSSSRLNKAQDEKDKKERTEEFNWTEDSNVKAIADEYRKVGNQVIWVFDFEIARRNQPLRTPQLIRGLDSRLKRNSISDPIQMLPFLKALSNDERVPLISRNHAKRLAVRIESAAKKEDEQNPKEQ